MHYHSSKRACKFQAGTQKSNLHLPAIKTIMQTKQRRDFIKSVTAFGALAVMPNLFANAITSTQQSGYTVLFQGDSITDGNRTRNNDWNHVMGHGYAYTIASKLWFEHPERGLHFFNRGISGNKVTDLADRWQTDTLEIKPDLLSILIGINDTSAFINGSTAFTAQKFEEDYRQLLQQTKEKLPAVQLVLCEPFILEVGNVKTHWDKYLLEVQQRQLIVRKLATEFNAIHVPFQKAFDEALSKAPADYWIWDGIHPMPAGHELMAREWIRQVKKKVKVMR